MSNIENAPEQKVKAFNLYYYFFALLFLFSMQLLMYMYIINGGGNKIVSFPPRTPKNLGLKYALSEKISIWGV